LSDYDWMIYFTGLV